MAGLNEMNELVCGRHNVRHSKSISLVKSASETYFRLNEAEAEEQLDLNKAAIDEDEFLLGWSDFKINSSFFLTITFGYLA